MKPGTPVYNYPKEDICKNKATLFCPQGPRAHLLRKHGYRSAAFIEYFHKL